MPELPEVETVRKNISNKILSKTIKNIELINIKSLRNVNSENIKKVVNEEITLVDRIAKHLIIHTQNYYFIMHLRMEGRFTFFKNREELFSKTKKLHHILIIDFENFVMLFSDTRKFATIDMFGSNIDYNQNPVLLNVGKEPFDLLDEELFNWLQSKKTNIKSSLLDQSFISGLGNIYVDEVLFAAKIDPRRISNEVTFEETKLILHFSKKILKKSIEMNGSSVRTYEASEGEGGKYQNELKVYSRAGKPCLVCSNPIIKIKVAGRGTHICTNCQK